MWLAMQCDELTVKCIPSEWLKLPESNETYRFNTFLFYLHFHAVGWVISAHSRLRTLLPVLYLLSHFLHLLAFSAAFLPSRIRQMICTIITLNGKEVAIVAIVIVVADLNQTKKSTAAWSRIWGITVAISIDNNKLTSLPIVEQWQWAEKFQISGTQKRRNRKPGNFLHNLLMAQMYFYKLRTATQTIDIDN